MDNKMGPIHLEEQLQDELDEMGMSGATFAAAMHAPANRIAGILGQKRGFTADTALRLARYLGTTADYWMNCRKCMNCGWLNKWYVRKSVTLPSHARRDCNNEVQANRTTHTPSASERALH